MTPQQVFDKVAKHLLTQKKKSIKANRTSKLLSYSCAYRDANGLKCAVGIMINDDEYSPDMENMGIATLLESSHCPVNIHKRLAPHRTLLMMLQNIHDFVQPDQWEGHLKQVAGSSNLKWTLT